MLFLNIIQVVLGVLLIVIVMLQSGKSQGLSGALTGGSSETFLSKNKSRGFDARMAQLTKWVALLFVGMTLLLSIV